MAEVPMDTDPLEVLRSDLEDKELEIQLEAVRELETIAEALGPEKSRTRLLDMIEQYCFSLDRPSNVVKHQCLGAKDEVLREVARSLNPSMIPLVGGPEHALPIVVILQKLAMVEETVIRESAMTSMIACTKCLSRTMIDNQVLPLVAYLSEAEWWTSRVSAASCCPRMFELFESAKAREAAQEIIQKLCKDEMPMVRLEVYGNIPVMIPSLGKESIVGTLSFVVPVLKSLGKELSESMRSRIVEIVEALVKVAENTGHNMQLTDTIKEYVTLVMNDGNWRVRSRFLDRLLEIAKASNAEFLNGELLPGLARRLEDVEPSVRVKAIKLLPSFFALEHCSAAALEQHIDMKLVNKLVKDEFPEVRDAMSGSLLPLVKKLPVPDGTAECPNKPELHRAEICEILKQFHQDESGEVRLNFCQGLIQACGVVGEERVCNILLPLIVKLQEDSKWRVRCGVINNIPFIAELAKAKKIPEFGFHEMLITPFKDPVCAVRNAAVELVPKLADLMGMEWVYNELFDIIVTDFYHTKSKYLLRVVPIRVAARMAKHICDTVDPKSEQPSKISIESCTIMICNACSDSISNVRLVAAHALTELLDMPTKMTKFEKELKAVVVPLSKDVDKDVKALGLKALRMFEKIFGAGTEQPEKPE